MITAPIAPDLTGRSILVVEDEFYLAMEVRDAVQRAGGTVIGPFADAAGGIAALAEGGADQAVIDINLGEGPAFDLADALVAHGVPFLFLTGYDAAMLPDRFAAVRCIQKPVTMAALLRTLELGRG